MREYPITIKDPLRTGLRHTKDLNSGSDGVGLSFLSNCIPSELGLTEPSRIIDQTTQQRDWPFPMLFRTSTDDLLLSRSQIRINGMVAQTVNPLTDFATTFYFHTVPHLVDLGPVWILSDGQVVLYRTNYQGILSPIYVLSSPKVRTLCYHKGRVLMGGVTETDNMWSEDSNRLVYWSSIGGGDAFEPLLGHLRCVDGVYPERFYRSAGENLIGWCNPGVGEVHRIHPFGQHVLVFGSRGVSVLTYNREGPGAYGQAKILDIGISNRGHVAGDEFTAIFMDSTGVLWMIGGDLSMKQLDYHEFLSPLQQDPHFLYLSGRREFYLSDEDSGLVLTPNGLSMLPSFPSSVLSSSGEVIGTLHHSSTQEVSFSLTQIDFSQAFNSYTAGQRPAGNKRLVSLTLEQEGLTGLEAQVQIRYEKNWVTVPPVSFGPQDVAYVGLSGENFKITVTGNRSVDPFLISSLVLRFQHDDGRYYRGGT